MIYASVIDAIGNTPIIKMDRLSMQLGLKAKLFAKVELFNPSGSSKDRAALYMILAAQKRGELRDNGTIIIATSGNTGVGIAMISAVKGYHAIITMPDNVGVERVKLLQFYGARVELTPSDKGMSGAVDKANELHAQILNSVVIEQFDDPQNPLAHEQTTANEILQDLGDLDVFVAGVGTGGTFSGTVKKLKTVTDVYSVAVEPLESPLLTQNRTGKHGILGIGANFVPANFDSSLADEIVDISTQEAKDMMERLALTEGLFCGISSGAAVAAAVKVALREGMEGKKILALLPDTGERYLSLLK